jgi:hypothetical protein
MKVENGKIVQITEPELYSLYLEREMDTIMDFGEYKFCFKEAGCIVEE